MFVYRWEMVRELFSKHKDREGDAHDGLPDPIYRSDLRPAGIQDDHLLCADATAGPEKTLPVRTTSNLLVSPFEGQGYSMVEGKRYDWKEFDTIAIPGGSWYELTPPPRSLYSYSSPATNRH